MFASLDPKENMYFDSFQLREFVLDLVWDRELLGIRYYIWQIKQFIGDEESKRMYDAQQKVFAKLKREWLYIVQWRIQKLWNMYHEKWVDVKLAIDLVEWLYENRYDRALVISSDTDLKPVYDMVNNKWKKVKVILFNQNAPITLSREFYNFRVLNTTDLLKFWKQRTNTDVSTK